MFSRSQPCLRSRRISAALDSVAVASNEPPLLFLYPRWFTASTRNDRPAASINTHRLGSDDRRPSSSFLSSRCCPKCRLPTATSTRRWLSSAAPLSSPGVAQEESNDTKTEASIAHDEGQGKVSSTILDDGLRQTSTTNHGAPADDVSTPRAEPNTDSATSPPPSAVDLRPVSEQTSSEQLVRRVVGATARGRQARTRQKSTTKSTENRPVHFRRQIFVNLVKRLSATERKKLRYGRHVSKYATQRRQWRKRVHWTDLVQRLDDLEQDTRVWSKHVRHKVLHLPEETVALMGGMLRMEENIWHVPIHNGCQIRVLDPAESEGLHRKVIITGTKRVIELVESGILKAQIRQERGDPLVEVQKPLVPIVPSVEAMRRRGLTVPLIRGVWVRGVDRTRAKQDALEPVRADEIPKPSPFTVKKFAEYVEDIVTSVDLQPLQKDAYDNAEVSHVEMVEKMLVALFYDEANQKFISTGAANMALEYLCKHEFLSSARRVLAKCESVATPDTYNILLQSAADRQDLNVFHYILHSMARLHVQPNDKTWIAFLRCIVSPNIKAKVMHHMESKGLLARSETLRSALQLTVHDSLVMHLERGGKVSEFIEMLNQYYGPKWQSALIINQMFRQLLAKKDTSTMLQLAEICEAQRLPVDGMTLRLMITFFSSDIQKALWFLFRYTNPYRHRINPKAVEKLFLIAFKDRSLNVCRVLWRYACTKGSVSRKMKDAVVKSAVRNQIKEDGNPITNMWEFNSGKVIVGLELGQEHEIGLPGEIMGLVPSGFEDSPAASLVGYRPTESDRQRQKDLALALVKRDMEAGPMYRFAEPLSYLLEAAAVLDDQWNHTPRPLSWFLQNAIRVPIEKRVYVAEGYSKYYS
ncbi:hypothetical protein DTO212C5_5463 [Paecilomyces variotii]|nr:hypothetical protein DTO212C5_5463 [Paecilomyces variotii]